MSKEYTLADFTDIFDYSTGWFSDSSICSLFYQIFKRFPSIPADAKEVTEMGDDCRSAT